MAKRSGKKHVPFVVIVEFLVGLLGFYGIGRLFAGRYREARTLLIISLLLIIPIDFSPRLMGDQFAIWVPWLVRAALAALSALQFKFVLGRAS